MKRLIGLIILVAIGFYVIWPAFSGYQIHAALEASDPAALERKVDFVSVRRSMREPVMAHVDKRVTDVMKNLGPATNVVGAQIPRERIGQIIDGALLEVINAKKLVSIYANRGDLSLEIQKAVLNQINKMGGINALLQIAAKGGGAGESGGASNGGGGIDLSEGIGGLFENEKVREVIGEVAGKIGLDAGKLGAKLFPELGGGASGGPVRTVGEPSESKRRTKSSFGLGNIKTFGFAGPLGLQMGVARSSSAKEAEVTGQINFQDFDWKVTKITPNLGA